MHRQKGKKNTEQSIIDEIMRHHIDEGKSIRDLSQMYGMPFKTVKNMVTRENNKKRKRDAGITPRRLGRQPKGYKPTEAEKDYEIKRLRMENELLRDFLRAVGGR